MKRKIVSLIAVLALSVSYFSANVSANVVTAQSAPNTIYWSSGTTVWSGQYKFYTIGKHGATYRGYLSTNSGCGSSCIYSGTLYKHPLQYPTPF
ncbi:hypothetical protein LG307_03775 [Sutcliffiella horikoshii]|uniref:hypothetical protein n=1 Tax=Sutcliffiella horikoshii TaxID=79883 RepID=UPI00384DA143